MQALARAGFSTQIRYPLCCFVFTLAGRDKAIIGTVAVATGRMAYAAQKILDNRYAMQRMSVSATMSAMVTYR